MLGLLAVWFSCRRRNQALAASPRPSCVRPLVRGRPCRKATPAAGARQRLGRFRRRRLTVRCGCGRCADCAARREERCFHTPRHQRRPRKNVGETTAVAGCRSPPRGEGLRSLAPNGAGQDHRDPLPLGLATPTAGSTTLLGGSRQLRLRRGRASGRALIMFPRSRSRRPAPENSDRGIGAALGDATAKSTSCSRSWAFQRAPTRARPRSARDNRASGRARALGGRGSSSREPTNGSSGASSNPRAHQGLPSAARRLFSSHLPPSRADVRPRERSARGGLVADARSPSCWPLRDGRGPPPRRAGDMAERRRRWRSSARACLQCARRRPPAARDPADARRHARLGRTGLRLRLRPTAPPRAGLLSLPRRRRGAAATEAIADANYAAARP